MNNLVLAADPACPWSWLTVRWLTAVAPERGLTLRLQPYSLWLRNGETQSAGLPDFIAAIANETSQQSLRVMRVFMALAAEDRYADISRLYVEWASRVFTPGPPQAPTPAVLAESLTAAGLDASWLPHADSPSWDTPITHQMDQLDALRPTTPGASVPVLLQGDQILLQGAILAAPVTPEEGLALWDAFTLLTTSPTYIANSPTPPPFPAFA
ncbi:hypothetical protein ACFTSF_41310 [Kribbella sp. NPDC056951]|uniref:mycothiol-dependent nitroreductase Rv2466c family protein n=1 Tax=Kribbella sp. NPDC056951 TaxID=3345978 RepID=UPI003643FBB6